MHIHRSTSCQKNRGGGVKVPADFSRTAKQMTAQSTILSLPLTEEEEKLAKLIAEILVDSILNKQNQQ